VCKGTSCCLCVLFVGNQVVVRVLLSRGKELLFVCAVRGGMTCCWCAACVRERVAVRMQRNKLLFVRRERVAVRLLFAREGLAVCLCSSEKMSCCSLAHTHPDKETETQAERQTYTDYVHMST